MALIAVANNVAQLTDEERQRLKIQVLRQLIDETLEIQEAKASEITVTPDEISQSYTGVARKFDRTTPEMAKFLRASGSSDRSLKRQIEGELAWQRYLRRKVDPFVNVGDEEVNAILDRLQQAKGTEEYNLHEIYLAANDSNRQQKFDDARRLIQELQKGEQPFENLARQFSDASTKSVGGDLGWIPARDVAAGTSRCGAANAGRASGGSGRDIGRLFDPVSDRQAPGADRRCTRCQG